MLVKDIPTSASKTRTIIATGRCALEDQFFHGHVAQRMSADFLHRRMHVRLVSRSPIGELTGRAFNAVPSPDSFRGELERPGRIGDGTSLSLWHFPDLVAGPGLHLAVAAYETAWVPNRPVR